ncbi:MAG: DNA glycosylase [Eubacterium sp.]
MEKDNNLVFLNKTIKEVENIWIPYFDLNRDYEKIKEFLLKSDETLEPVYKRKKRRKDS